MAGKRYRLLAIKRHDRRPGQLRQVDGVLGHQDHSESRKEPSIATRYAPGRQPGQFAAVRARYKGCERLP